MENVYKQIAIDMYSWQIPIHEKKTKRGWIVGFLNKNAN